MQKSVLLFTLFSLAHCHDFLVTYSYFDFNDNTCSGSWQRVQARPMGCSPANGIGAPYGYIDHNETFATNYNCWDSGCTNCTVYEGQAPLNLSCHYSVFPPYHSLVRVNPGPPPIPAGWPTASFYHGTGCNNRELSFLYAQDPICRTGPQLPASFGASCSSGNYTNKQCPSDGHCDRENCTVNSVALTNVCAEGTKYTCPTPSEPTPGWIVTNQYANQDSCSGTPSSIRVVSAGCNRFNGGSGIAGYVTFSRHAAVYYSCTDPNCENCTTDMTATLGICQVTPGTYPRGRLSFGSRNLQTFEDGTSSIFYYSKPGCNDSDLYSVTNLDSVCRFTPHSAFSYASKCNATAVTFFSNCVSTLCDAEHCSSVSSSPVGECIEEGEESVKYVCQGVAPPPVPQDPNKQSTAAQQSTAAEQSSAPQQTNPTQQQDCQQDWQCASLGTTYGFAECQNGSCGCRGTFQGSATQSDRCRCDFRTVYDLNGKPNCVPPGQCSVSGQELKYLCSEYTENYQFIECDNGTCKCRAGFDGQATAQSKCRCTRTLSWLGAMPSCR